MLKILIVDDEYRDRKGMLNIIQKQNWDISVLTADSGNSALEILKSDHIDIMITDIRMPDMLGTELMKSAISFNPDLKSIFISAHKDFEYAQEGLRLGVIDYLLKPYFIEDFISIVKKAIDLCLKEKDLSKFPASQSHKDELFSKLINEPDNSKSYSELEDLLGPYENGVQPILINFLNLNTALSAEAVTEPLNQIFESQQLCFFVSESRFFILQKNEKMFLPNASVSDKIISRLSELFQSEICLIYGNVLFDAGLAISHYNSMVNTLEVCLYTECSIVLPENNDELLEYDLNTEISALQSKIILQIIAKKYENALNDVKKLFSLIEQANHLSNLYVKYISSDLISRIFKSINIDNVENLMQKWLKKIFDSNSANEIIDSFEGLIKSIQTLNEQNKNTDLINNIYHIIQTRYMTDLSLEALAKELYVSPSYLSHYFKNETGVNFIDYLKNYRLKVSCELLKNPNLQLSQICNKIGYDSVSYYCKAFKNVYHMTPTQYRKRRK